MQKRFWNWKDSDKTLSLNNWLLGILEPGLYRGFDFLPMAGLTLRLNHETNGIVYTLNDGSESPKTGVILSKQGVVIKESAPIDLIVEATLTQPRVDLITCTHEYSDEVVGGLTATYRVYSGVPDDNPVAPIPSDPNNEIVLGQLYLPANCTNLNASGVIYSKQIPPSLGNDALVLKNLASSEKTTFMRFLDAVEVGLNLFLKSGIKIRNKANDAWLDLFVRDETGDEVKYQLKNIKSPSSDYDGVNKIYIDSKTFIGEVKELDFIDPRGSFTTSPTLTAGLGTGIYTGWAICNGNNGTRNRVGKFAKAIGDVTQLGSGGGNNAITLLASQVPSLKVVINDPEHSHFNLGTQNMQVGGGGDPFAFIQNNDYPQPASTGLKGTGTGQNVFVGEDSPSEINIQPSYFNVIYIQKIP